MGAIGGFMKIAVKELERAMGNLGRDVNSSSIGDIVKQHTIAGTTAAVAAGILPGAGALIATGIASTSTLAMYVRLAKELGVTFKDGALRALASGLVADLSAVVVTNLVAGAAISLIPGVGQVAAPLLIGMANFALIYLAAYIFIKMLSFFIIFLIF